MSKKKRRHALSDHERRGKAYVPPFLAGLGDYPNVAGFTWHDDVLPEYVWLALLYRAAPSRAGELAREVLSAARVACPGEGPARFCLTTPWATLTPTELESVRMTLDQAGAFDLIASALAPLVWLYPECPLAPLVRRHSDEPRDDATHHDYGERVFEAVKAVLVRQTRQAAIVQGIVLYAAVTSHSMAPHGLEIQHLPTLMDYPETDASRRMESIVRRMTSILARSAAPEITWRSYFWRRGGTLLPCMPIRTEWHGGVEDSMETAEKLTNIFEELSSTLETEFKSAWSKAPADLAEPRTSEVIGGLLARQIRYARHLLTTAALLSDELGSVLLRSMVDSAITLVWLIRKGQASDYERFVQYGLGQEKLALDHLGATREGSALLERRRQQDLAVRQAWLQSQKLPQLLTVDVSVHWAAPKNIRQLAEEADMIDLCNVVYTPASAQVHGSWNAVARTALRYCFNPLHRLHMVPDVETTHLDLTSTITACRILQRSWDATHEWAPEFPVNVCLPEALQRITSTLDSLVETPPLSEGDESEDHAP